MDINSLSKVTGVWALNALEGMVEYGCGPYAGYLALHAVISVVLLYNFIIGTPT